jgi:HEAT repeat protein
LFSDSQELSLWASRALVKCRNGVDDKLSQVVTDADQPPTNRLAAMKALQLIPGKQSVLTLAGLLDDEDPQISQQAAVAISEMLYLPIPLNVEDFRQRCLPVLLRADEETILRWQWERKKQQLLYANQQLKQVQDNADNWRQRFLAAETEKFKALKTPEEKLQFLQGYLHDKQPDDALRLWALQNTALWSESASVRSKEIAQPLIDLLKEFITDSQPQVRLLTAQTLGKLDFAQVRPLASTLLEQLVKEKDKQTQVALLLTLGKLAHNQAVDQMLILWQETDDATVAAAAVQAIGEVCGSKNATLEAPQIDKIISSLAANYTLRSGSLETRREFVKAVKKMAEVERYRKQIKEYLGDILKKLLFGEDPLVRSQAVYALSQIYGGQILPQIMDPPANLLNDPDTAVRFAVITAIENDGSKKYLPVLRERVIKEENLDVAKRLMTALDQMLTLLSLEDCYDWYSKQTSTSPVEEELTQQSLRKLDDKINKTRQEGKVIAVNYEQASLAGKAGLALKQKQYSQAIQWYIKLLSLDITDTQKAQVRNDMLSLLTMPDLPPDQRIEILLTGASAVIALLEKSDQALDMLAQGYGPTDTTDPSQLLWQAEVITLLITPLKQYPADAQKQQWDTRRVETTLAIIDLQSQILAGDDPKNIDAIKLLPLLDTRLKDYPVGGTPEVRLEALRKFRLIVQPLPKPSETKAQPQPEPKLQETISGK